MPLEKRKLLFSCLVVIMALLLPQLLGLMEQSVILVLVKMLILFSAMLGAWLVGILDKRWLGGFASIKELT